MSYVPYKMQKGTVSITLNQNALTSASVTFPTAFASTPDVVVVLRTSFSADYYSYQFTMYVKNVTSSGFTVYCNEIGGLMGLGTQNIDWIAMA